MKYSTCAIALLLIISACSTKNRGLTSDVFNALTHKTPLTRVFEKDGVGYFEWADGLSAELRIISDGSIKIYRGSTVKTSIPVIYFSNGQSGSFEAYDGIINYSIHEPRVYGVGFTYSYHGKKYLGASGMTYPYNEPENDLQKKYYTIIGKIAAGDYEIFKPMKIYKSSEEILAPPFSD